MSAGMKCKYDHDVTQEQQQLLGPVSNKVIRLMVSALFITTAITALSLYLLRF